MVTGTTDRRPGNPRLRTLASFFSILLALSFALGQAGPRVASADEPTGEPAAPTEEVAAAPAQDAPIDTGGGTDPSDALPEAEAPDVPREPDLPEQATWPGPTAGPPAPPRAASAVDPAAPIAPFALVPGDVSLDLVAAGPFTYDHATGVGGAYGDRTISSTEGVVESLQGGAFACGDLVVFLTAITADEGSGEGTIDVSYAFAGRTTSGDLVGFEDLVSATINPNPPDTGNTGDGDESATIRSETTGPADEILATARVAGVEGGEQVILRLVVRLGCRATERVTGNIQSSITRAEVPDVGPVNVGTQTISLRQAGEIVAPVPALRIDKVADPAGPVEAGEQIGFVVTVANVGDGTATGVTLTDVLPTQEGLTWAVDAVGGGWTCAIEAGVLMCGGDAFDLAAGDEAWVRIVSDTSTGSCGTIVNIAVAAADGLTPVEDPAEVEVLCPPEAIGIAIEKDGPALAHVGDTVTYTFGVRLTTPVPLGDVVVTDPACDAAPTLVAREGGDQDAALEPGEVWRYTCSRVVTAEDPDPLPNTATVEGTAEDGRTATDRDDHGVDLIHPAIRIVKTVTPVSGSPGDVVTYRYAVTNVGDTTLLDVSIDDDVLGHIGDVAILEPGETVVLTAAYVLPDDATAVVNVGVASGEDELGEAVSDDDDADVTVVLGGGPTPTPPPTNPPTAFTGSDVGRAATIAGGLLLLGTIAVLVARRRTEDVG